MRFYQLKHPLKCATFKYSKCYQEICRPTAVHSTNHFKCNNISYQIINHIVKKFNLAHYMGKCQADQEKFVVIKLLFLEKDNIKIDLQRAPPMAMAPLLRQISSNISFLIFTLNSHNATTFSHTNFIRFFKKIFS